MLRQIERRPWTSQANIPNSWKCSARTSSVGLSRSGDPAPDTEPGVRNGMRLAPPQTLHEVGPHGLPKLYLGNGVLERGIDPRFQQRVMESYTKIRGVSGILF